MNTLIRKSVILLILCLAVGAANLNAQGLSKVRYGGLGAGSVDIKNAYIFLGIEKGFFKNNGLNVQFFAFDSPSLAMAAAARGETDCGDYGTPVYTAIAAGIPIKVIAALPRKSLGANLIAKNEYKSVADLKGKMVLTGRPGAGGYTAFTKIVQANGFTTADFKTNTASVTVNDARLVLQKGDVEAIIITDPLVSVQIEQAGEGHVIARLDDYYVYQHASFYATDAFIKNNPGAVRSLLKSLSESAKYAYDHPDELYRFINQKLGYDLKTIKKVYESNFWDNWNYTLAVKKDEVRKGFQLLIETGEIKKEQYDALKDKDIFALRFLPNPK
jgi:ABC-type nitrate/sulfonate/bicarbonate transport systems, periplasmic components